MKSLETLGFPKEKAQTPCRNDPAIWEIRVKFSTTHCTKIERIALVGDKAWEKWMAGVCKPFTMAKVRYFEPAEIDAAWAWLAEP
jgi:hypothetical protein